MRASQPATDGVMIRFLSEVLRVSKPSDLPSFQESTMPPSLSGATCSSSLPASRSGSPIEQAHYALLAKGLPALQRARKRAEELAIATNTALVQVIDGQVVRVYPKRPAEAAAEPQTSSK